MTVFILLLVGLLLGAVCIVLALRCGSSALTRLTARSNLYGEPFTAAMGLKAVAWAVGMLCVIYGVSLLYCAAAKDSASWETFYSVWARADSVHYRNLAELGYFDYTEDGQHLFLVFFPLYPWLMRLLSFLIPNYDLCGHLLSATAYIGGCYVLARLVTEDLGWRTAKNSLLLFSAYPFAFFFAGIFTESLFFLLSSSTFYCIRKHRYLAAGLLGALGALTRMQGVLLILAGIAEYIVSENAAEKIKAHAWRQLWRGFWRRLLPLAIMLTGVGIYLWLNYAVEGNPFQFSVYQREHWYQYPVPVTKCLSVIIGQLTTSSAKLLFTTWLPEFLIFLLCLGGLLYGARQLPVTYGVYLLGCVLLNYSLSWPLSCGRYMACAFPLPITIAAASNRRPLLCQGMACVFAVLQGAYLYAFLSGTSIW
ncbi:MAG: glycosyltransferase family 39 protein [Oscillospiraceae bacterium]|nr:glycosyltransferase family 39 protein [Oscillospiraceae bacterium]